MNIWTRYFFWEKVRSELREYHEHKARRASEPDVPTTYGSSSNSNTGGQHQADVPDGAYGYEHMGGWDGGAPGL